MTKIIVPGKPIAKARPRFYRIGEHVGTYNCQTTEEGKWLLMAQGQIKKKIEDGPIYLVATFFMPRPKYHYGTGKNARVLKPSAPLYHVVKPDSDNLVKFVKDCLNGFAWKDDCQVCSMSVNKIYDEDPRTEIEIIQDGFFKEWHGNPKRP